MLALSHINYEVKQHGQTNYTVNALNKIVLIIGYCKGA